MSQNCTLADIRELRRTFRGKEKTAFIVGYTGAIGRLLVGDLLNEPIFRKVILIGRRKVPLKQILVQQKGLEVADQTFWEQKVVDFDNIDEHKSAFSSCDVGYCCLGTTRKKSGKEGFIKVDHDYVFNSARLAKEQGCKEFHFLSSMSANAGSCCLYPRVKGEVENELKSLNFDRLIIYRPGILFVDRDEFRCGEQCYICCISPFKCCCGSRMGIDGNVLAQAMINKTISPSGSQGKIWEILENRIIVGIGRTAFE